MTQAATATREGWTRFQLGALVTLRMLIGWHFLYEGLAKMLNPYWTSAGYLAESQWWFKGFFFSLLSFIQPMAGLTFLLSYALQPS